MSPQPAYRRVLLKLSGEVLMGSRPFGIAPDTLPSLAAEVAEIRQLGVEVAIVIGGGNIIRGIAATEQGLERITGDYMGMLATIINALALQDALERRGCFTRVMTALELRAVAEPFIRRRAIRHLEKGRVVIFAAGTGNPYFSTDTAAALRAMEIGAQALFKATKVEGIYDRDPAKHQDAQMYDRLTYDRFLADRIGVMDSTAVTLCRENKMPIRVFKLSDRGNILRVCQGAPIGTVVEEAR